MQCIEKRQVRSDQLGAFACVRVHYISNNTICMHMCMCVCGNYVHEKNNTYSVISWVILEGASKTGLRN